MYMMNSIYIEKVYMLRNLYEDIYNYIETSDLISGELYRIVMNYDDIVLSKFRWDEQHHLNSLYEDNTENKVRFNIPTLSPLTPNSTPRSYLSPPPAPRGERLQLNNLTFGNLGINASNVILNSLNVIFGLN